MAARLPRSSDSCNKCDTGKLAVDYRRRLQARLERDKWLKSP